MGTTRFPWILLAGDIVTFALVTIFGFATHGTLDSAGMRMLTTFLPVLAAWLLFAPFFGVYQPGMASNFEICGDRSGQWFWRRLLQPGSGESG